MFRNVELKLEERVPRETFFRSSTGVYGKKKNLSSLSSYRKVYLEVILAVCNAISVTAAASS